MDGLEGIKLLETIIKNEQSNPGLSVFFAAMFSIGLVIIIGSIILAFLNEEPSLLLFVIVGVPLLVGSIILFKDNSIQAKYYKITPIEEKYFIDLSKYDIIETSGEIITVKEKQKK